MFAILVGQLGEQLVSRLLPCLPDNSSLPLSGTALCLGQAGGGSLAPAACASGAPGSSAQVAISQQIPIAAPGGTPPWSAAGRG